MPSSVSPVHRPPDDGNGSTHDDDAGTNDGNGHGHGDGDRNEDRVSLDAGASNRMETDAAATATNESSLHHDGDIENADAGGEYLDNDDDDDDEDPPSPPTAQRPSKEALLAEQFWQASAPPVAALPQQSRAASASNGGSAAIDDCSDNDTTGDSTAMQNSCNSGDSQNSMHRKPSASNKGNDSTNTSALTDEEIKAELSALQRSPVNAVGGGGGGAAAAAAAFTTTGMASTAGVAMPQHFGSHLHLQSHSFDSSCHRSNGANRPLHHSDHGNNGNIGRNQAGNANDDELLSPQDAVSIPGAFHSDDRPLALRGGGNAGRRHGGGGQDGLGATVGVGRPIDSSSAQSAANANDGTRTRAGAGSDGAPGGTGDSLHSQKMQAYYHPSNATTAMNGHDDENNNNNTSSSSRSAQQQQQEQQQQQLLQHSSSHMPSNRSYASSHDAYSYRSHADVENPILIEATLVIDNETVPASMTKPPDGDESKSPESNDTSVDGSVSLVDRNASNASRAAMEIESGVNNLRQQSQPRTTTTTTAAATGTATTAAATTGSSSNNQHHAVAAAAEASSCQASSSIRGSIIVVANTVDDDMKKRNRVILFVAVAVAVILAVGIGIYIAEDQLGSKDNEDDEITADSLSILDVIAIVPKTICFERNPGAGAGIACSANETLPHGGGVGNVVAKALLSETPSADFCIINSGAIRDDIHEGNFTVGDALSVWPFENRLVAFELTGPQIVTVLEQGFAGVTTFDDKGTLLLDGAYPYAAGLRYDVNMSAPVGSRLMKVEMSSNKEEPMQSQSSGDDEDNDGDESMRQWKPLNMDEEERYVVVVNSFMATGRDNFFIFPQIESKHVKDLDAEVDDTIVRYALKTRILLDPPLSEYSTQKYIPHVPQNRTAPNNRPNHTQSNPMAL